MQRANNLNQSGAKELSQMYHQHPDALVNLPNNVRTEMHDLMHQVRSEFKDSIDIQKREFNDMVRSTNVPQSTNTKPVYQTLDRFYKDEPFQTYTRDSRGVLVTAETRGQHVDAYENLIRPTKDYDLYRNMGNDQQRDRRISEVIRMIGKPRWTTQSDTHLCMYLHDFATKAREHNMSELEILYKLDTVLPRHNLAEVREYISKRTAPFIQQQIEME